MDDKESDIDEQLLQISKITGEIELAQLRLSGLKDALKAHVMRHGSVEGYGVRGYMKQGRKKIDHMGACHQFGIDNIPSDVIENASTTKTTVKWAAITKNQEIPLDEFTIYGDSVFTIEVK